MSLRIARQAEILPDNHRHVVSTEWLANGLRFAGLIRARALQRANQCGRPCADRAAHQALARDARANVHRMCKVISGRSCRTSRRAHIRTPSIVSWDLLEHL